MNEEIKLKPCPFCNGHNIKIKHVSLGMYYERVEVCCADCGSASASGSTVDATLELQAIKNWNRRA